MKKAFILFINLLAFCHIQGQEVKISHIDSTYFEDINSFELKNDLPDGTYKVFTDQSKNSLELVGELKDKKRENTWTWYFETGNKRREIQYRNGVYNGQYTSYYPNGAKSVIMVYTNGILNGPITRWFQDGTTCLTGTYANGNPSGVWKYYKEDGTLVKEDKF